MITYNTHLFYQTAVPKKYKHEDDRRLDRLLHLLKQCDADIIGLNEVWSLTVKNIIKREMEKNGYRVVRIKGRKTFIPPIPIPLGISYIGLWLSPLFRHIIPDNGLMFLCKKAIDVTNSELIKYKDKKGVGKWDKKARKGILKIDIAVKADDGAKQPCHVFVTHTYGAFSNKELCEAVRKVNYTRCPVFVLGDLNVDEGSDDYDRFLRLPFETLGIRDTYRTLYADRATHPGYTDGRPENKLHNIFWPEPGGVPKRLDYILANNFVDPGSDRSSIEVLSWTYHGTDIQGNKCNMDLSDHDPVKATFELSLRP